MLELKLIHIDKSSGKVLYILGKIWTVISQQHQNITITTTNILDYWLL